MKNLILFLSIFIFGSCTMDYAAVTVVDCPCTITKVTDINKDYIYLVRATSITEESYFEFETTHLYNISDTIK